MELVFQKLQNWANTYSIMYGAHPILHGAYRILNEETKLKIFQKIISSKHLVFVFSEIFEDWPARKIIIYPEAYNLYYNFTFKRQIDIVQVMQIFCDDVFPFLINLRSIIIHIDFYEGVSFNFNKYPKRLIAVDCDSEHLDDINILQGNLRRDIRHLEFRYDKWGSFPLIQSSYLEEKYESVLFGFDSVKTLVINHLNITHIDHTQDLVNILLIMPSLETLTVKCIASIDVSEKIYTRNDLLALMKVSNISKKIHLYPKIYVQYYARLLHDILTQEEINLMKPAIYLPSEELDEE